MTTSHAGIASRIRNGLAAAAACLSLAGAAQAAPVTLYFSGAFSLASGEAALLDGLAFSGTLTYDAARAPDHRGGNFLQYLLGAGAMTVSTARGAGSSYGTAVIQQSWNTLVGTAVNGSFTADAMTVSTLVAMDAGLSQFGGMGLALVDAVADADDPFGANLSAMPTGIALAELDSAQFRLGNSTGSAFGSLACLSTSSTACRGGTTSVPEPASLALTCAAFLGLAGARRRR